MRAYDKYIGRKVKVKPEANYIWCSYGIGTITHASNLAPHDGMYTVLFTDGPHGNIIGGFSPRDLLLLRGAHENETN